MTKQLIAIAFAAAFGIAHAADIKPAASVHAAAKPVLMAAAEDKAPAVETTAAPEMKKEAAKPAAKKMKKTKKMAKPVGPNVEAAKAVEPATK